MDDETRAVDRPWYEHDRPIGPDDHREPTTEPLPIIDDAATERFATPIGPSSEPPATRVLDPVDIGPAAAPTQRLAEPVAPPPAPAPVRERPAPRPHGARPAHPPPAPAPYAPAPRSPGPNGFARFGAVVFALALAVPGVLAIGWALLLSTVSVVADAASDLTQVLGVAVPDLPGGPVRLLILFGGVVLIALAALTARLSGSGVGIAGLVLLVAGIVALVFPNAVGDWLIGLLAVTDEGIGGLLRSVGALASAYVGTVAVVVGAAFAAVAGAVHGARLAGWDRGRGV